MLKKLTATVLSLILMAPLSAHAADENWPTPENPTWLAGSSMQDVRLGQWLQCKAEWKSTTDCIQSVSWYKLDGTKIGDSTFTPNGGFDPFTTKQKWQIVKGIDGVDIQNSTWWDGVPPGFWNYPTGLANSDGTTKFQLNAHVMFNSLQVTATAEDYLKAGIPENVYMEVKLKTLNMYKHAGSILSNARDPQAFFDGDVITLKVKPAKAAWAEASNAAKVCDSNQEKARTTNPTAVIMLNYIQNDRSGLKNPGDLVVGTNGWWCINGINFDQQKQQLNVQVGNTHFDEFGKVIEGWFDVKVKGSKAKAWWGMDPRIAAGQAKVEVSYEDGTSTVATTIGKYDEKNDWVSIEAYGFHFSSPNVAITFKKPETPKVEPVATQTPIASEPVLNPAPVKPTVKKSTIICVKGKTSKKVTAVNPKCPAGYKKK